MKDVLHKALDAGIETEFKMKLNRSKFLVKNFTSDTIEVRLGDNDQTSIIGADSYEIVFNNVDNTKSQTADATDTVKITSAVGGIVEVASIDF